MTGSGCSRANGRCPWEAGKGRDEKEEGDEGAGEGSEGAGEGREEGMELFVMREMWPHGTRALGLGR